MPNYLPRIERKARNTISHQIEILTQLRPGLIEHRIDRMLDSESGGSESGENLLRCRFEDVADDGGDVVDVVSEVRKRGSDFVDGVEEGVFEGVGDGFDFLVYVSWRHL